MMLTVTLIPLPILIPPVGRPHHAVCGSLQPGAHSAARVLNSAQLFVEADAEILGHGTFSYRHGAAAGRPPLRTSRLAVFLLEPAQPFRRIILSTTFCATPATKNSSLAAIGVGAASPTRQQWFRGADFRRAWGSDSPAYFRTRQTTHHTGRLHRADDSLYRR
jgi:hypothetical protein